MAWVRSDSWGPPGPSRRPQARRAVGLQQRTHAALPPPPWVRSGGRGYARIVYKNPWVRKLKIGIRAKREATDGKGDVLCIT